ncbi:MAG: protein-glutamate O-methyltransferase CheR [Lachnospiraceae bacterium]|nr:protein-glutamate O-methyltransferase CheR [Lachnospiraceae bacterium]
MIRDDEFSRIATFLKGKYGIDMSHKKEIMNGRLENYVRAGGYKSFGEYMDAVERDITGNLEKKLVNMLTTNHTFFMREFEHFEFLKREVLPYLKRTQEVNKDLCIWCGAASTGEEPYTIAMVLKEFFGLEHPQWDTKVLATDISTEVLEHAVAGIYTEEHIETLPESWRRRFFKKHGDGNEYMVTDELKNEVIFRKFNLMEPFPFKRKMHVVFLRNVMIYFDSETKKELIRKVYDSMEPGGYLFVGQTETIDRSETPFQLIKPSVFRKREGER